MSKLKVGEVWRLSDVLNLDGPGLRWKQRVQVLRDVATVLTDLHAKGRAYGQLCSSRVLIFPGCKAELQYNKTKVVQSGYEGARHFDILCFGVLMLELCSSTVVFRPQRSRFRNSLSDGASSVAERLLQIGSSLLPKKHPNRSSKRITQVQPEPEDECADVPSLDIEDECPLFMDVFWENVNAYFGGSTSSSSVATKVEARGDDLEIQEAVSEELTKFLENSWAQEFDRGEHAKISPWGGSIFELCKQSCCTSSNQRPEAEFIQEWLKEVLEELSLHSHQQKSCEVCLGSQFFELCTRIPTVYQVTTHQGENDSGKSTPSIAILVPSKVGKKYKRNLSSSSSVSSDLDGYDTSGSNDSYMPEEQPQSFEMTNKLQSFLKELGDSQSELDLEEDENPSNLKWPALESTGRDGFKFSRLDTFTVNQFQESVANARDRMNDVSLPSLEEIENKFVSQIRLDKDEASGIIRKASSLFSKEQNVVRVENQVVITIGDIHGQYFDMLHMLREIARSLNCSSIPEVLETQKAKLLFLGDYVDRGDFSCEVIFHIFWLKISFPESIYLIRGNHESESVASYFGFKSECESKYGPQIYNQCVSCFRKLPIAAIIPTPRGDVFACHGGISPNIRQLSQLEKCDRFREPGMNGLLCDLLWSDPIDPHESPQSLEDDEEEEGLDESTNILEYSKNSSRGCSYYYGRKAMEKFLSKNKLVGMVRAHEVQEEGYHVVFDETVATVFSAPNYCNRYGNLGAFLMFFRDTSAIRDTCSTLLADPPSPSMASEVESDVGQSMQTKWEQVGSADSPFAQCLAVQFREVKHPEPIELPSEKETLYHKIQDTCPYMPSTMQGFVETGLALGEQFGGAALRRKSMMAHAPKVSGLQRAKTSLAVSKATKPASPKSLLTSPKSFTSEVRRFSIRRGSRRLSRKSLGGKGKQKRAKKKKKKGKKYRTAAASDKLNEMHPNVVANRFEDASKRLESRLAHSSRQWQLLNSPRESLLDLFDTANRRALTESVKEVRGMLTKDLMLVQHFASWFESVSGTKVQAETFCDDLQDGVVLCKMFQYFDDKLMPHFHSPEGQWNNRLNEFQKRENILKFQYAFRKAGLRQIPFDISDLRLNRLDVVLPCLVSMARFAHRLDNNEDQQTPLPKELVERVGMELEAQPVEPKKPKSRKKKKKKKPGTKSKKKKKNRSSLKPKQSGLNIIAEVPDAEEASGAEEVEEQHGESVEEAKLSESSPIQFSQQEMVLLELVYMMIDRNDDGLISTDELVAWGVDEGVPLSRDQAQRCLTAVDADNDGVIGLDDFLAFAGQLKQLWLYEKDNKLHVNNSQVKSTSLLQLES